MDKIKNFIMLTYLFVAFVGCGKEDNSYNENKVIEEISNENQMLIEKDILDNDTSGEIESKEIEKEYPLEIIGPDDFNFDGNMYFWDLNVDDTVEVVKEKLETQNCEFEDGTDYADVYKIWNKGIMLQEWENLNFLMSYYNRELVSFKKWNVSSDDLQKICKIYGVNFDVSTLRNPQYYIFNRGKYNISIGNEGYYDALHEGDLYIFCITNSELASQIQQKYDSFE